MMRTAIALLLFAAPSFAGTTTWEIDTAHTNAQFAVKHLMVSTVRGTMGPVTGTVTLDDSDLTKSTATASVDTTGVDTRNEKRDEHLRAADFFDVANAIP
jgi:polyisoprenoid-binding protein YceI